MSVQNGGVVLVTIGGVTVGALVSNGHNQLADMLDASNKDTAGVKQFKPGETGWNFTLESLYDPAATEGVSEALGYLKAGTALTITHGISGTSVQSGSGYISSIECNGPKNEIGSYSLDIQGTGAISPGLGSELIADPDFDNGCGADWLCNSGWAMAGGKANATAATTTIVQAVAPLTPGTTYKVVFTISDYTGGTVRAGCGNGQGTLRSSADTFEEDIVCADNGSFFFDGVTAFTGSISVVSVKAYL